MSSLDSLEANLQWTGSIDWKNPSCENQRRKGKIQQKGRKPQMKPEESTGTTKAKNKICACDDFKALLLASLTDHF